MADWQQQLITVLSNSYFAMTEFLTFTKTPKKRSELSSWTLLDAVFLSLQCDACFSTSIVDIPKWRPQSEFKQTNTNLSMNPKEHVIHTLNSQTHTHSHKVRGENAEEMATAEEKRKPLLRSRSEAVLLLCQTPMSNSKKKEQAIFLKHMLWASKRFLKKDTYSEKTQAADAQWCQRSVWWGMWSVCKEEHWGHSA